MVGRPSFPFRDPAHFQGRTVRNLDKSGMNGLDLPRFDLQYTNMAIAGKSAFFIGNTSSFMVDFPWIMLVYQKLALWKLQPFNCKTNKAREKMQIESTFNHLRPGRLRLWEKRYKQNIQNLDFFKMCINFNVYNCIRNARVCIFTERQGERVWVHVLFFTIYNVLYLYIYLFGIVLNCICIRMRYCIASWHAQYQHFFFIPDVNAYGLDIHILFLTAYVYQFHDMYFSNKFCYIHLVVLKNPRDSLSKQWGSGVTPLEWQCGAIDPCCLCLRASVSFSARREISQGVNTCWLYNELFFSPSKMKGMSIPYHGMAYLPAFSWFLYIFIVNVGKW